MRFGGGLGVNRETVEDGTSNFTIIGFLAFRRPYKIIKNSESLRKQEYLRGRDKIGRGTEKEMSGVGEILFFKNIRSVVSEAEWETSPRGRSVTVLLMT